MKKTLATLLLTVMVLLGLGIVVLASASTSRSQVIYHSSFGFFYHQLIWLGGALLVGLAAAKFDYHYLSKISLLTWIFYGAVALLLVAVICPGLRMKINGSYRWLSLGPLRLQPSELAKLAIVMVLSVWMDHAGWRVTHFWRGAFFPAVFLGLYLLLLVLEPDFGATMVVGLAGGLILFINGTKIWHLLILGICGLPPIILAILNNANRMNRIRAWFSTHFHTAANTAAVVLTGDAARQEENARYQLEQAIIAIQNGGPWGVGLNNSVQKYYYLPEAHTDFIFAIGAEEMGYGFSISIVVLYAVLLVCGTMISLRAPDRLGRLLAFGMTFLLAFQAAFNIGVVTGCLPTKGLALPFISYGGTNLISAMIAIGVLINVGLHVDAQDEKMHTQLAKNALNQI